MEKLPKKRVSKTKSQKLIHSLTTQKNRAFLKKISANEMLLELEKGLPNINTLNFVKQIKKEHPNLFFNFDNMFKQPPFNENNFENFDNSDEENF